MSKELEKRLDRIEQLLTPTDAQMYILHADADDKFDAMIAEHVPPIRDQDLVVCVRSFSSSKPDTVVADSLELAQTETIH
jgi:hypothetical protein